MIFWLTVGLLALAVVGIVIIKILHDIQHSACWHVCRAFAAAYAVLLVTVTFVSVARHWVIFDQVSGLLVAAFSSGCAAIYAHLRINQANRENT